MNVIAFRPAQRSAPEPEFVPVDDSDYRPERVLVILALAVVIQASLGILALAWWLFG